MKLITSSSFMKLVVISAILVIATKFGIPTKEAHATSTALSGKCALIANHNMAGFDSYCSANVGHCDNSVSALVALNFDTGNYQYAATAVSSFATTSIQTSQHTGSGTFTVAVDQPLTGYYTVTLDSGESHILYPVNSGNTFLTLTSVSGTTPAQTGVCQKV